MKLQNTTVDMSFTQLCQSINKELSNAEKVRLAKNMSDFFGTIDMSYVEDLLVMAAKLRLKAIKKDKALYNRNRNYFKALKIIAKVKYAE